VRNITLGQVRKRDRRGEHTSSYALQNAASDAASPFVEAVTAEESSLVWQTIDSMEIFLLDRGWV